MGTPSYSELKDLVFDRAQVNATVDAPISDAVFARGINKHLRFVWEKSGRRIKNVASATAWTSAQTATGVVTGILTDVAEIVRVWASTTSGSVGQSTGDVKVEKTSLAEIDHLRTSSGYPTYLVPKYFATSRKATSTPASMGLLQLDYWPSVTGFYLPIRYEAQFVPIDSATITTPDLDDVWAIVGGLMYAEEISALAGRHDLTPGITLEIERCAPIALARTERAMADAGQYAAA